MASPGGILAAPEVTERAPDLNYGLLTPMIVILMAGVLAVLVEAFVPRERRREVQVTLSLGAIGIAFVVILGQAVGYFGAPFEGGAAGQLIAYATVAIDRPTLFLQGAVLIMAFLSLLLMSGARQVEHAFAAQAAAVPGGEEEREHVLAGSRHTEVYPLVLFAVLGMMLFPASNDFLTMFIALEVLSLPLYLLCALSRTRRLFSQEAAVKYFLLGAFASAFFLFGIAMIFGYAGSVHFADISAAVDSHGTGLVTEGETLLMMGIALVAVGLLFKVGAVPFHNWKPDVYQGAPTPVTALMASATLIAGFGALLRVFASAFDGMAWDWRPMLWIIAILTMVVASIIAVTQRDIKRLLAYSSVIHAGFILTAVVAFGPDQAINASALSAALFYLGAYGFATVGAFAVVTLVRVRGGDAEAGDLAAWAGLGRTAPWLAGALTLFLLAFAGIPLTSGFIGKFAVFEAAMSAGAWPLVVIGVLASAVTAYFYLRIVVLMYFQEAPEDGPRVVAPSWLTGSVITVGAAATIALGVLPGPVFNTLLPDPDQSAEAVAETPAPGTEQVEPVDMFVR
nr:NADH-quinone oxidoreductase subunit NuoN [Spiractinospora alimapuensis]